jgi:protein-tyrosine phosphatase
LKPYQNDAGNIDPFRYTIRGRTGFREPETFEAPLISEIAPNHFQGGTIEGVELPRAFRHLISLYPWEQYRVRHELDSMTVAKAFDADVEHLVPILEGLAAFAAACIASGPTAIVCKGGLNRSGILSALVLMKQGMTSTEAIQLLRAKRSPAVLSNPSFRRWLLDQ